MREFSGTWMRHSGDFWGGGAAMLVALPAAVAFGVTVYSAIKEVEYAEYMQVISPWEREHLLLHV